MNVVVKLSKEEIEGLIKDHLLRQGFLPKKVEFKVSAHDTDEGSPYTCESFITSFNGVEVDAERKP